MAADLNEIAEMISKQLENSVDTLESVNEETDIVAASDHSSANADTQDEYIPGSAAPKLPQQEEQPDTSQEEEVETHTVAIPKPKIRRPVYAFSTLLTVICIILTASFAFFLLSREVAIQQQRNAIFNLEKSIKELRIERDSLYIKYNSSIDIDSIRESAQQLGMHEPTENQIVDIN